MKLGIVVIGYNRVNSIKRLIESLLNADYEGDAVDLIISIDNSGTDHVEKYAQSVIWPFGEKLVKTYPERLGLRSHILTCGDYVAGYDAIAVFEDDIFVSPAFYRFMKEAVRCYQDEPQVAGISLYTHLWNENAQRPFCPEKRQYDTYYLQYAQSWGQVWMPKQWRAFRAWYEAHGGQFQADAKTPKHITRWAKTSWLKYHIKYCIDENKYFVYPYFSYTTNYVEVGQHCKTSNKIYQVPMAFADCGEYRFPAFGAPDAVYYDGFFERQLSPEALMLEDSVSVDLYGMKEMGKARYLLSTQRLDYPVVKSYGLYLRPQERNVLCDVPGNDIFLYDTREGTGKKREVFTMTRWDYDSRVFDYRYILKVVANVMKNKLLGRDG